ncbi:hypothetical protein [Macrococcus animalis]|uniref:hypothetical protein n=1 Tax=Macrococcus animalis TaxID=3395467 RepID=UPI0039BEEF75
MRTVELLKAFNEERERLEKHQPTNFSASIAKRAKINQLQQKIDLVKVLEKEALEYNNKA